MSDKKNIGNRGFIYPMPVTLLGATVRGKPNYMTLAWITNCNYDPPMVCAAVGDNHYTMEGIREMKSFSINFPGEELLKKTDYCGLVSGNTGKKADIFETFYGELETAPMIAECPISMECSLKKMHKISIDTLVIGEIVAIYTEDKYLTDGKPDISKMKPLLLTMPDNHYWSVGDRIGTAWKDGKDFKK